MARDDTGKKGPGAYVRARQEAAKTAKATRRETPGMVLFEYPDYETYRQVQTAGNKAKLRMQFVPESHIATLSARIVAELGPAVAFGLCHGTRRGQEQAWFRTHLPGDAEVIGTEISDTATDFPHTVQWDFHDLNPDWSGRADFVYSNSWDHAFDPEKAFGAWIDTLRPGGLMLLDHTSGQLPKAANALDPFGVTWRRLRIYLEKCFGDRGTLLAPIDTRDTNRDYRARVVVFRKAA